MKFFFEHKKFCLIEPGIVPLEMEIDSTPETVQDLILSIVEKIVIDFNKKDRNKGIEDGRYMPSGVFGDKDISEAYSVGRISFGVLYNDRKADVSKAFETAVEGYKDGLFKIFINGEMTGNLESGISIKEGDLVSVIRLTFLSGRLW